MTECECLFGCSRCDLTHFQECPADSGLSFGWSGLVSSCGPGKRVRRCAGTESQGALQHGLRKPQHTEFVAFPRCVACRYVLSAVSSVLELLGIGLHTKSLPQVEEQVGAWGSQRWIVDRTVWQKKRQQRSSIRTYTYTCMSNRQEFRVCLG